MPKKEKINCPILYGRIRNLSSEHIIRILTICVSQKMESGLGRTIWLPWPPEHRVTFPLHLTHFGFAFVCVGGHWSRGFNSTIVTARKAGELCRLYRLFHLPEFFPCHCTPPISVL